MVDPLATCIDTVIVVANLHFLCTLMKNASVDLQYTA